MRRVGEGGQGDVWEAWDFEFRRRVAMKRLDPNSLSSAPIVYRFLAEAQIASQLEHPGVLPIFDVGLDPDGRPFYTTQLLPETNLETVWSMVHTGADSPWTAERALGLLLHVCDVMAHAHSRGVIHRDLKPANILIGAFGEVRVIDWGSAHVLKESRKAFEQAFVPLDRPAIETARGEAIEADPISPYATAQSGGLFTILFTPPESLSRDRGEPEPRTDIYALGVMLYQLLAGRAPYSDAAGNLPEHEELKERIRLGPPDPLRRVNAKVSRDLAAICEKAMAHSKADRYASMTEVAEDIRAALEFRPVQARRPGPVLKVQKWARRNISYVLVGSASVVVLAVALAFTVSFKAQREAANAQRDAARQISEMRTADLAMRSGDWRGALEHWAAAERAGYSDLIDLGLKRAEAWIVLSEKPKAKAQFDQLLQRHDLGAARSAVLLRAGELEMFARDTFEQGVRHVREASTNSLNASDEALARGLLADSTPEALHAFRRAVELNPYFHSAHRHSLGLEFILGRHEELASHLRVAKVLYPGDFSPGQIEVVERALQGRTNEAQRTLDTLRAAMPPDNYLAVERGVQLLSKAAVFFQPEVYLGATNAALMEKEIMAAALQSLQARHANADANVASGPLPQLPAVEQGLRMGFEGITGLAAAKLLGGTDAAIEKVQTSLRHHPEGLFAFFAGTTLDRQQPRTGPRNARLLALQAGMYQMATDLPSILPYLPRLARVLATDVQEELALSKHTNAATFRTNCVANLRRAALDPRLTPIECGAFARWSYALKEYDLDRQFLSRWEAVAPGDPSLVRNRIRLEMATEAYGPALKLIEQILADNPNDAFAKAEKARALKKIQELQSAIQKTNP